MRGSVIEVREYRTLCCVRWGGGDHGGYTLVSVSVEAVDSALSAGDRVDQNC